MGTWLWGHRYIRMVAGTIHSSPQPQMWGQPFPNPAGPFKCPNCVQQDSEHTHTGPPMALADCQSVDSWYFMKHQTCFYHPLGIVLGLWMHKFFLKQLTVKYAEKRTNRQKITSMGHRLRAMGKLLKDQRNAWGVRKSSTRECWNKGLGPRWSCFCSWCYLSKPKFRLISCPSECSTGLETV